MKEWEEKNGKWGAEMGEREKEELRQKARKLVVERGLPVRLVGVMGGQASAECVGRVFDCLQVENVSRGVVFGLLLQGLRAVVQ